MKCNNNRPTLFILYVNIRIDADTFHAPCSDVVKMENSLIQLICTLQHNKNSALFSSLRFYRAACNADAVL